MLANDVCRYFIFFTLDGRALHNVFASLSMLGGLS